MGLIIISCSRKTKNKTNKENKKTQTEKDPTAKKKSSTKEKKIQILRKNRIAKSQTNPKYDSEHQVIKFEKQLQKRWCFSLKNKNNSFHSPPPPLNLKNEQKKISLFERKVKKKNPLH